MLLLLLAGCRTQSPQQLSQNTAAVTERMLALLGQIETRQDCLAREEDLEKLYLAYAELIIKAEQLLERKAAEGLVFPSDDQLSESLRAELLRVYDIDGCREIVERAQEEAMHKLVKVL